MKFNVDKENIKSMPDKEKVAYLQNIADTAKNEKDKVLKDKKTVRK